MEKEKKRKVKERKKERKKKFLGPGGSIHSPALVTFPNTFGFDFIQNCGMHFFPLTFKFIYCILDYALNILTIA